MADVDYQGNGALTLRLKEIVSGVYARMVAAVLHVGNTPVSASAPLPVTLISGALNAAATVPSIAADNHAPADNTAAVVTYAAVAAKKHYIYGIYWAYDSDLTVVGTVKVEDVSGTTVFGPLPITASGPGFLPFDPPIVSSAVNTAMIVTLATGGAAVQGVLSCRHEVK